MLDTSTSTSLKLFHRSNSKTTVYFYRFQNITFSAGLVLELDDHKMQCASKRLAQKGSTFILVEKKQKDPNDDDYDAAVPFYYSALLDDWASLYPDIKVLYNVCACCIVENKIQNVYDATCKMFLHANIVSYIKIDTRSSYWPKLINFEFFTHATTSIPTGSESGRRSNFGSFHLRGNRRWATG